MIDFQGLLAVLTATENEHNFDMSAWHRITGCGTTHCMVGAFCSQNKQDLLYLEGGTPVLDNRTGTEAIALRFGITVSEAKWLFTGLLDNFALRWRKPMILGKHGATKRLRKLIYYKLHKQEMIAETSTQGGKYTQLIDQGRHISGRQSAVLASTQGV